MDHITYDSSVKSDDIKIEAPYYNAIRPTKISFVREHISALVDSLGHVEFLDSEDRSLGFVDVPAAEAPDLYAHSGQYGTVWCSAQGDELRIRLPIYQWEDDYPHCDGESDRWTRRTIRHFQVVFNCKTLELSLRDR